MSSTQPLPRVWSPLDVERIRSDFPVLGQTMHGKRLVYLDSAASAQTPQVVIDALCRFYARDYANIHRGVYELSERATRAYENAREIVRRFLRARDSKEIVFVRNTTEAINLVAAAFVRPQLRPGDEILLTEMEHHSNIVPWQLVCEERGALLRVVPVDDRGELDLDQFRRKLTHRTRFVSVTHVSNALGTVNPVRDIVRMAHAKGIPVLLDGAQAAPHMPVDVVELDCDFYAFSGHKTYGPTGIGVLYGKAELLEGMRPYQGGGEMIRSVTFEKTVYNSIPYKFEAGTPNIAGAIGLGAALEYMEGLGLDRIRAHEQELLAQATERIREVRGVRVIGEAREKAAVLSFVLEGVHPHDIGTVLDREGVAIRAGHHCAQPLMRRFGLPATARASFGVYNGEDDIEAFVRAVAKAREILG
ncbi:MAG: cysteine desulfurase [Candidatus Binatia bacterium]|nr:MAG: cysteine desulfurase [Candidatus Binatia bacterium]